MKEQEDGFESSKDKRNADVTLANGTSFSNDPNLLEERLRKLDNLLVFKWHKVAGQWRNLNR